MLIEKSDPLMREFSEVCESLDNGGHSKGIDFSLTPIPQTSRSLLYRVKLQRRRRWWQLTTHKPVIAWLRVLPKEDRKGLGVYEVDNKSTGLRYFLNATDAAGALLSLA
jgi:hypothetical protein